MSYLPDSYKVRSGPGLSGVRISVTKISNNKQITMTEIQNPKQLAFDLI
jgi:hypothetical protein